MTRQPRIAVHNPLMLHVKKNHTLYAYVIEFFKKYKPLIYLSKIKKPLRYFFWPVSIPSKEDILEQLRQLGITYNETDIIESVDELNERADILVNFNGENFIHKPEAKFHGMKIHHTQDFVAYCTLNYKALRRGGVDYIFGTGKLDKYSEFFRKTYPYYVGKVLSFPFGYADRFKSIVPFEKREDKVVVTGSVNPISIKEYSTIDVLTTVDNQVTNIKVSSILTRLKYWVYYHILITESSREFEEFYAGEAWVHPFRRMIVEHEEELKDIAKSQLPVFPKIKQYDIDLVKELNKYKMSLVDDGLIEIVGGKAFESIAAGAVLVCPDFPFYNEWGFVDGKNCVKYKDCDLKDFRRKIEYYVKHPKKLKKIQEAGEKFVTKEYNHKAIAAMIYKKIGKAYNEWLADHKHHS